MKNKIRYHVEWCSKIPLDKNGDSNIDGAKYIAKNFTLIDTAIQFAVENLPNDCFGCTRIEEQEYRLDEDVFRHEGWKRYNWHLVRIMHVHDKDYKYSENDFLVKTYA